jgi:hypothetical protein
LTFQIRERGEPQIDVKSEFTRVGDNVIVGSAAWLRADGRRQERFQVITLRDGKIAEMQGCRSRREAERVARQRMHALAAVGGR